MIFLLLTIIYVCSIALREAIVPVINGERSFTIETFMSIYMFVFLVAFTTIFYIIYKKKRK